MLTLPDYKTHNFIYESANSIVYRGIRERDNQPVILKLLREDYPSPQELTRYKSEYEITRSLHIDGAVKAFGLEHYDKTLVIIFEDFGGESLKNLMKKRKFTLAELLKISIKIAEILGHIHATNIIHKDINPANLVFNPDSGCLKIIDFGISTQLTGENRTLKNPNVLEGTLAYMSPEQTGRMNRTIDYRTDFYSLGVTLYELLTHQLPFSTTDVMELVHCHIAKQPIAPRELSLQTRHREEKLLEEIPEIVSKIVMKLMAKNAEDRYQSAWGLKADLEECLKQLEATGKIVEFPLGQQDISDKFHIPQKLYGRDREIKTLLTAFERISQGSTEMMLVSGYSGIGKSAIVQEIYKPITRHRGYFIAGKFDQFQRNIPYSAIVSAFQSLIRQLLTESEAQLKRWKEKLLAAFGPNGQIIIDVIPEVELIVGQQAIVQELGPAESQNRFNLVFQNFIRVFCSVQHPLVIFLDDLQWADSATLKLIEVMMTDEQTRYLFLIGAYRDNEVDPTHPLMMTLDTIRHAGSIINNITLAPLELEHITHLIAETLHSPLDTVKPLAELVVRKTQGNPFFVNQFLKTLYQENLIAFHPPSSASKGGWQWNIARIEAMDITDNVVELMIRKLKKLPDATQQVLQLAACVGNMFDLHTLSIIHEKSAYQTFKDILPAIQEGLILPISELELAKEEILVNSQLVIFTYQFLHDRVQQSGYALIDEKLQKVVHLQIGRLLIANISAEQRAERIFELVDHLNLGRDLMTDDSEKVELATLNLAAARKAKDATAYAAAREYAIAGLKSVPGEIWSEHYELAFTLHKELADVEYLNGNFERSEALINLAFENARSAIEKAEVYNTLIVQYTLLAKYAEAIQAGLKALSLLGINLPEEDLTTAVKIELAEATAHLADKSIASLAQAEKMKDPTKKVALKLLGNMGPLTFLSSQDLWKWTVVKAINLSLQYGFVAEGSYCYSCYGIILNSILGDYQSAYEFGKLALYLSETSHNLSQNCQDSVIFANYLNCWVKHIKSTYKINNEGYKIGSQSGNLQWTGYNRMFQTMTVFYQGMNLEKILEEISTFILVCRNTKNQWATDIILANKLAILNLMGQENEILEAQYLESFHEHKSMAGICEYHVLKAQAFYLYDRWTEALTWAKSALKMLDFIMGHISKSHHNFYYSLILAALYPEASPDEKEQYWTTLVANQIQMKIWADNGPENFRHKYLLVEAEICRISGKDIEAMNLYDEAIAEARENQFIQNEALANELAAKFWLARGKEEFASLYLNKAYCGYRHWGAKGKVQDLDLKYPQLLNQTPTLATNTLEAQRTTPSTTSSQLATFDLATIVKASQAISGEIIWENLVNKLVKIAIENAGAETGLLLGIKDSNFFIEAAGSINSDEVVIGQDVPAIARHDFPISVVNHVFRTQESVVLNNACSEGTFTTDPYIIKHHARSILCTSLIHKGKIIGFLYLENNLTPGAFTNERLELLKVLCAQVAISLENARLYTNLSLATDQLKKANEQLEDSNRTLEIKVEERTAELKDKNALLEKQSTQLEQTLQELKTTQTQLIQTEKMSSLGQLVAGVAHEINNPVNFIYGNLTHASEYFENLLHLLAVYQEEYPEYNSRIQSEIEEIELNFLKEDLHKLLYSMKIGTKRICEIVLTLRNFSRLDEADMKPVDIHEGIDSTLLILQHRLKDKPDRPGIQVIKEYGNLPQVGCYASQLNQVFMNILTNALDALEQESQDKELGTENVLFPIPNPQIRISTEVSESVSIDGRDRTKSAIIRIADNGPGMSSQVHQRLFDPFFTTKPVGAGTGLGLSISYSIVVEKHGGQLTCVSAPGQGAEFTIAIPLTRNT